MTKNFTFVKALAVVFLMLFILPMDVSAAAYCAPANISGLVTPVAGATPVSTVTPSYGSCTDLKPTIKVDWNPKDSKFVAGKQYTVYIEIQLMGANSFTGTMPGLITIDNCPNKTFSGGGTNRYLWLCTYPATSKAKIAKPTAISGTYTYNSSSQTPTLSPANTAYRIKSGSPQTNAGTYTVVVELVDKTATEWSDGSQTDVSLSWTINKKDPGTPTTSTANYGDLLSSVSITKATGDEGNWAWSNGGTVLTASGSYPAVFTTTNSNYNSKSISIPVTVNKNKVAKPTLVSSSFTYSGSPITVALNPENTLCYEFLSGQTGTAANSYTAVVRLKDPTKCEWTDGTTANVNLPWNITKADASTDPSYTIPSGLQGNEGQALSTVLPALTGNWKWDVPTTSLTTSQSYSATYTPSNSNYAPITMSLPVTVKPVAAPEITTSSLPNGTYNKAYNQSLAASGGNAPYTSWSITSGSLPAGLSLSGNTITGIPTATSSFSFTVKVEDSSSPKKSGVKTFTIVIDKANAKDNPAASGCAIPGGLTGAEGNALSSVSLSAYPRWTWNNGAITYLSTSVSQYSATCTPSDPNYEATTDLLPVNVTTVANLSITTSSLPNGTYKISYPTQTIIATGGLTPYTWSRVAGTLPPGLTLSGNAISGTPTAAGTYTFDIEVNDDSKPDAKTARKQFTIVIDKESDLTKIPGYTKPSDIAALNLTGNEGKTLSTVMPALPAGWDWVNGTTVYLSIHKNTYTATYTPADSNYAPLTYELPVKVIPIPEIIITTNELPEGTHKTDYVKILEANGGEKPYTWTVTGLPAGLTLNSATGEISGRAVVGTYTLNITVNDNTTKTDSKTLSLIIGEAEPPSELCIEPTGLSGFEGDTLSHVILESPWNWKYGSSTYLNIHEDKYEAVCTPAEIGYIPKTDFLPVTVIKTDSVAITTVSLSPATYKQSYSETLNARGGLTPYTWSHIDGTLPTGLNLIGNTITGTPSAVGEFTFTVKVLDNSVPAKSDVKQFTVKVEQADPSTDPTNSGYTIPSSLSGDEGSLLSTVLLPPGWTWKIETDPLTTTKTYNAVYTPVDQNYKPIEVELTVTVNSKGEVIILTATLPNGTYKTDYNQSLAASGGLFPYTWEIESGTLPIGLTLNPNGTITGNPTKAETFTFTVKVIDNTKPSGKHTSKALSIVIDPADPSTLPEESGYAEPPFSTLTGLEGNALSTVSLPSGWAWVEGVTTYLSTSVTHYDAIFTSTNSNFAPIPVSLFVTVIPVDDVIITTNTLPNGKYNETYNQAIEAKGGNEPYTWSKISGTLPDGLTGINNISGKPTKAGIYTFTVKVQDTSVPVKSDEKEFTIVIDKADASDDPDYVEPDGTQEGEKGKTLADVELPDGWTWDDPDMVLDPSITEYPATYTPKDTDNYDDKHELITVNVKQPSDSLTITTDVLPNGTYSVDYSKVLAASGGQAPYNWSVISGNLPVGLTIIEDVISGTAGAAGTYTFTVKAEDYSSPAQKDTKEFTIVIDKADPSIGPYYADYNEPTSLTGMENNMLSTVSLELFPGWTWADETDILNISESKYNAIYTPEDTANYNILYKQLLVTVNTLPNISFPNINILDSIKVSVGNEPLIPYEKNNHLYSSYMFECKSDSEAVEINMKDADITINKVEGNIYKLKKEELDYGNNDIPFTVTPNFAGVPQKTINGTLTVNMPFPADKLVQVRWGNTMTIIDNSRYHNYDLSKYAWYKNGKSIGTGRSWSLGSDGRQFHTNDRYHVEVQTKDGQQIRSCEFVVDNSENANFGIVLTKRSVNFVEVDVVVPEVAQTEISVYNLAGHRVLTQSGKIIDLRNIPDGLYIVKTKTRGESGEIYRYSKKMAVKK